MTEEYYKTFCTVVLGLDRTVTQYLLVEGFSVEKRTGRKKRMNSTVICDFKSHSDCARYFWL